MKKKFRIIGVVVILIVIATTILKSYFTSANQATSVNQVTSANHLKFLITANVKQLKIHADYLMVKQLDKYSRQCFKKHAQDFQIKGINNNGAVIGSTSAYEFVIAEKEHYDPCLLKGFIWHNSAFYSKFQSVMMDEGVTYTNFIGNTNMVAISTDSRFDNNMHMIGTYRNGIFTNIDTYNKISAPAIINMSANEKYFIVQNIEHKLSKNLQNTYILVATSKDDWKMVSLPSNYFAQEVSNNGLVVGYNKVDGTYHFYQVNSNENMINYNIIYQNVNQLKLTPEYTQLATFLITHGYTYKNGYVATISSNGSHLYLGKIAPVNTKSSNKTEVAESVINQQIYKNRGIVSFDLKSRNDSWNIFHFWRPNNTAVLNKSSTDNLKLENVIRNKSSRYQITDSGVIIVDEFADNSTKSIYVPETQRQYEVDDLFDSLYMQEALPEILKELFSRMLLNRVDNHYNLLLSPNGKWSVLQINSPNSAVLAVRLYFPEGIEQYLIKSNQYIFDRHKNEFAEQKPDIGDRASNDDGDQDISSPYLRINQTSFVTEYGIISEIPSGPASPYEFKLLFNNQLVANIDDNYVKHVFTFDQAPNKDIVLIAETAGGTSGNTHHSIIDIKSNNHRQINSYGHTDNNTAVIVKSVINSWDGTEFSTKGNCVIAKTYDKRLYADESDVTQYTYCVDTNQESYDSTTFSKSDEYYKKKFALYTSQNIFDILVQDECNPWSYKKEVNRKKCVKDMYKYLSFSGLDCNARNYGCKYCHIFSMSQHKYDNDRYALALQRYCNSNSMCYLNPNESDERAEFVNEKQKHTLKNVITFA